MDGTTETPPILTQALKRPSEQPFELAQAILAAARECLMDMDPAPFVVVIDIGETGTAQRIFNAITEHANGSELPVVMDILPDARTGGARVVLTFRKRQEAARQ